jgi:hypothetical protein
MLDLTHWKVEDRDVLQHSGDVGPSRSVAGTGQRIECHGTPNDFGGSLEGARWNSIEAGKVIACLP